MTGTRATTSRGAAGLVLLTLAAAQFLMVLDSSVMNVSISEVAKDVHTSVTGIQTAITFYALVMATLVITGGRLGTMYGRRRMFSIGLVVYGTGSVVTAVAPNLAVLLLGWSVLEGIGGALILPAIVALVATNFGPEERPRAYGAIMAASAAAVAAGPVIGGLFTTYLSWRLVFASELIVSLAILSVARRMEDHPAGEPGRLDPVGTLLSAVGLGLIVFGVLRAGTWGLVRPRPGGPVWIGLSPVIVLIAAGGAVVIGFLAWEQRRTDRGLPALFDPAMLRVAELRSGLNAFGFQFFVQAGLFFTIPLFLSVALGLSAVATGVRLLPLSVVLTATALGLPRLLPNASPRRIVRAGFLLLAGGTGLLVALLDVGSGPDVITWPLLVMGVGIGAMSSQLGAITVGAVPEEQSSEVGGLQNTVTNFGSAVGTALAGAILIAALSSTFFGGLRSDPDVPKALADQASVELAGGVPFVSDAQLETALHKVGVEPAVVDDVVTANADARVSGLRTALAVLALVCLLAWWPTRDLPTEPVGGGGMVV